MKKILGHIRLFFCYLQRMTHPAEKGFFFTMVFSKLIHKFFFTNLQKFMLLSGGGGDDSL